MIEQKDKIKRELLNLQKMNNTDIVDKINIDAINNLSYSNYELGELMV